mmetsp:Transcript_8481/g.34676  ORF Transcript_8481/g.34676 Transcript_8481/m.34676 type:complete len:167 (-) Transcript_8481:826-1326(-)
MSRARTPLRASSRPAAISSAGSFTRYSRVASPAMDAVRGGSRARRGAAFDDDANPPRGIVGTGWCPAADDARLAALAAARAAFLSARILDVARCPHDEAFISLVFEERNVTLNFVQTTAPARFDYPAAVPSSSLLPSRLARSLLIRVIRRLDDDRYEDVPQHHDGE